MASNIKGHEYPRICYNSSDFQSNSKFIFNRQLQIATPPTQPQTIKMKTSSITTTFLAMTGAAIAAPTIAERNAKSFQLTKLTASLYDQSLPSYRLVNFDLKDPNNNVDTSCSASWYVSSQTSGFKSSNGWILNSLQVNWHVLGLQIQLLQPYLPGQFPVPVQH